jgi:2-keto-3-deoxy-L-rhamnonate aldolase RhmA
MDDELAFFKNGADIVRLLQIECKSFIDDLEEIAADPFVDGFILGFADLSGSIGEIGEFFGENNMALARKAIEIATRHGKIVGTATLATDEATLRMLYDMGIKMIFTGADFGYIIRGTKETYTTLKKVLG